MSDEQTRDLLRKMLDRLDADWTQADNLTQIGRIAKAAERAAKESGTQSSTLDDIRTDVIMFLRWLKQNIKSGGDDGDEPWRESLGG